MIKMKEIMDRYINLKPVTIDALVSLVDEVLPQIVGSQESDKVAGVPTVRTIRYYISNGLVDKPLGYEGSAALYGYRHLLQLLVIKHLQANNFQIKKIGEIIQGLTNKKLEGLLISPGKGERKRKTRDMASPLLMGILKSKLKVKPTQESSFGPAIESTSASKLSDIKPTLSWKRLEIEPGFEIHLREDYPPKGGSQLDVLLSKIKHLLRKQMKNQGG